MAVSNPPKLTSIRDTFGGSGLFSTYIRNGPNVPTNATTGNISTTTNGLRMSQFTGADKNTAPPVPEFGGFHANDFMDGPGACEANCMFLSNGQAWVYQTVNGNYLAYTWLPAGRSASEYQIRTRQANTTTWGPWRSLGTNQSVASASASGDGFYDSYDYYATEAQIGYNGIALTGIANFSATAQVRGRG